MRLAGLSSVLLIGKNGSGKTTVALALEVLQKIGKGTNRVSELIAIKDLPRNLQDSAPTRFELEVEVQNEIYVYKLAFERVAQELRVREEEVHRGGNQIYRRDHVDITLMKSPRDPELRFPIDEHLVALPVVQSPLLLPLKFWLSKILLLRPEPGQITGNSAQSTSTLQPAMNLVNFGDWFSNVLALKPASYRRIHEFLVQMMPDFTDIQNPQVGNDARTLIVKFSTGSRDLPMFFLELSDGEKCFMIGALVLAANEAYGPLFCFWDEPDNFLALDEVGHFVMALRRSFQENGQFIATSHNPEAIRVFSRENTLHLHRKSHLEPTIVRRLDEMEINGDLISALARGDIEP